MKNHDFNTVTLKLKYCTLYKIRCNLTKKCYYYKTRKEADEVSSDNWLKYYNVPDYKSKKYLDSISLYKQDLSI